MTNKSIEVEATLRLALEALENNRQTHYYCEDTWYSCPKHEDGCANESNGDECNCGADKKNAEIDKAIAAIKEALSTKCAAQPELARKALESTETDFMNDQFDLEEKALIAIDFALEKL